MNWLLSTEQTQIILSELYEESERLRAKIISFRLKVDFKMKFLFWCK